MTSTQNIPDKLPEGVLYRGKEVSISGHRLFPEIHDLNEEPVVRVLEPSGDEYLIPAKGITLLAGQFKKEASNSQYINTSIQSTDRPRKGALELMVAELHMKLGELRFDLYNPINLPGIEAMDRRHNRTLTLKKYNDDPNLRIHPTLVWDVNYIKDKNNKVNKTQPCWKVVISEIPNAVLGSAEWSDKVGIENLVANLENLDALMVMLALANPTAAMEYSSKEAFIKYANTLEYPVSNKTELESFLSPIFSPNDVKSKINVKFMPIVVMNIPIAISIEAEPSKAILDKERSYESNMDRNRHNGRVDSIKNKLFPDPSRRQFSSKDYKNESKAFKSSVQLAIDKWIDLSKSLINESQDWRIVELPNLYGKSDSYIVSRMPIEVWESDIIQKILKFAQKSKNLSYESNDENWGGRW